MPKKTAVNRVKEQGSHAARPVRKSAPKPSGGGSHKPMGAPVSKGPPVHKHKLVEP